MLEKDRIICEKILKYCDKIDEILKEIEFDKDKYLNRSIYQLSTDMCVYQIGELSNHINVDVKKAHLEIPWAQMKGMRNIHAHEYDAVDREKMWYTLIVDISELRKKISKMLG